MDAVPQIVSNNNAKTQSTDIPFITQNILRCNYKRNHAHCCTELEIAPDECSPKLNSEQKKKKIVNLKNRKWIFCVPSFANELVKNALLTTKRARKQAMRTNFSDEARTHEKILSHLTCQKMRVCTRWEQSTEKHLRLSLRAKRKCNLKSERKCSSSNSQFLISAERQNCHLFRLPGRKG